MQESPTEDRSKFCNFFQPSKTCSPIFFDWKKKKKGKQDSFRVKPGKLGKFHFVGGSGFSVMLLKSLKCLSVNVKLVGFAVTFCPGL